MKKVICCILLLFPLLAGAQSFYNFQRQRSLILTGGIGTASYFGDLKDPGELIDVKPTFSIGLRQHFTPHISIRSELTVFTLKGNDKSSEDAARQKRNLSFKATNFELNVVGMFDLFPRGRYFYQRPGINFYGLAGIGVMYMNPKAELDGETYALQPMRTENVKYARVQPVIPYGIGARFKVNPFLNVGIEGVWRLTFTDYLDDVSTVHQDKTGWDPIRAELSDRSEGMVYGPGSIRGDSKDKDNYYILQLRVNYYLPNNFLFGNSQNKLMNVKRKAYKR